MNHYISMYIDYLPDIIFVVLIVLIGYIADRIINK